MTENEFDRYIELYRTSVKNTAYCIVKNPADAEDVSQEVFLRLYTYKGEFKDDEHVKAWLLRCTINRGIDTVRSRKSARVIQSKKSGEDLVLPEVMKLKPKLRTAIYLYYYEGYSVEEAADILKISGSAVKWRLSRGRQKLREVFESKGEVNYEL